MGFFWQIFSVFYLIGFCFFFFKSETEMTLWKKKKKKKMGLFFYLVTFFCRWTTWLDLTNEDGFVKEEEEEKDKSFVSDHENSNTRTTTFTASKDKFGSVPTSEDEGELRWGESRNKEKVRWEWEWEHSQEREKTNKILNGQATVTVRIYIYMHTVTVVIAHKYTILHPLIWVFFCSNCAKLVTFSILHNYTSTDVIALIAKIANAMYWQMTKLGKLLLFVQLSQPYKLNCLTIEFNLCILIRVKIGLR